MSRTNPVTRRLLLALTVGWLAGCGGGGGSSAPEESGQRTLVAKVNEVGISDAQLAAFMRLRRQDESDPAARERSLSEYIDLVLLAREARQSGLEDDRTQAEIEVQRVSLLANRALTEFARGETITPEELETEYSRQIDVTGDREYLLKHILVTDESSAVDILARLKEGVSFDLLAEAAAPELGRGNAGTIGWVNLTQVPASFAEPLARMTPGNYAPRPILSEYGWHVLYMEQSREFEPPEFDEVKEGIRSTLARQSLERHLESLRSGAEITRMQPAAVAEAPATPESDGAP